MEDILKKLSAEIVTEFAAHLETPEVKSVIEATEKGADAELGTFEVVISTENVDRYGEVIKLDAWELEHYRKNPIVLWGHDHHTLPVALATSVEVADGKMIAKGKFAPHDFAQQIRKLYDLGMMRATSVGFIEKEREGNLITKAELIEFSFVTVPANPFALSTLVKSGVSVNEMVTKGFVHIDVGTLAGIPVFVRSPSDDVSFREVQEEDAKNPVTEPQDAEEPPVADPDPRESAQRHFDTKAFDPIISNLKSVVVALEDLAKGQEPEGDEAPQADEDQKGFDEFSEKRRKVQEVATILGEVLAEARQAIEAKKQ